MSAGLQTCDPSQFQRNFWSALHLCFMYDVPPQGTLPYLLLSDRLMRTSVSGGFLHFDQEWKLQALRACQKYNPSLPSDSCERNHRRSRGEKIGRTEMLMNKGANEVECETQHLLRSLVPRTGGRERQRLKRVHKEAGFQFCSVALEIKCGKYQIVQTLAEAPSPLPHHGKERDRFLRKLLKLKGCFEVLETKDEMY